MATWVTHLMIADKVLQEFPEIDRRGFCVGNIAPDCNIENEDWTAFTPSREVTHWMKGQRKKASDCDPFCEEYILKRRAEIHSEEEYAFLIGYYAHLLTDAAFQAMIRDENRVAAVWSRIEADDALCRQGEGMPRTWDSVKLLIPKNERMHEICVMEAEYLKENPASGYLTEILPLKEFPDYIDYLPHGSIVRKIGVMGYIPQEDTSLVKPISLSREEFEIFVKDTGELVIRKFKEMGLITRSR